ncbi:hypothetical protein D3C81_1503900 [compost metagenome]
MPGGEQPMRVMPQLAGLPVQPRHAAQHLPHDVGHRHRRHQRIVDHGHRHAQRRQHAGDETVVALVERAVVAAVDEHQQRRRHAVICHGRRREIVQRLILRMPRARIGIAQVRDQATAPAHPRRPFAPARHMRRVVRHVGAVVVFAVVEDGVLRGQAGEARQRGLVGHGGRWVRSVGGLARRRWRAVTAMLTAFAMRKLSGPLPSPRRPVVGRGELRHNRRLSQASVPMPSHLPGW